MSSAQILTRFSKNFNDNIARSYPYGTQKNRFNLFLHAEHVAVNFIDKCEELAKQTPETTAYFCDLADVLFLAFTLKKELHYTVYTKYDISNPDGIWLFKNLFYPDDFLDIKFSQKSAFLYDEIYHADFDEKIPYAYAMATALSNQSKFFLAGQVDVARAIDVAKKNGWLLHTIPSKENPLFFFYKNGKVQNDADFGYQSKESILFHIFNNLVDCYKCFSKSLISRLYEKCYNEIALINVIVNKSFPHLTMGQL